MTKERYTLLKEIYNQNWEFTEFQAKNLGLKCHLEFLEILEEGDVFEEIREYNSNDIIYRIMAENKKYIINSLIDYEEEL